MPLHTAIFVVDDDQPTALDDILPDDGVIFYFDA